MSCKTMKTLFMFVMLLFIASPLSAIQKDRSLLNVIERNSLLVGMDVAELPWIKRNLKIAQYEGFEYEIVKLIAQKLDVKLVIVNTKWSKLPEALLTKKIDIIVNAYSPANVGKEMVAKIFWSEPYYHWGWAIAVSADDNSINGISDLKGKVVGCFTDAKEYFSKIDGIKELKVYPRAAYDKLLAGEIDAFIYDSPSVYYTVKTDPRLKVAGPLIESTQTYNIGFRAKDEALRKKIESILHDILESPEYKAIMNKWLGVVEK